MTVKYNYLQDLKFSNEQYNFIKNNVKEFFLQRPILKIEIINDIAKVSFKDGIIRHFKNKKFHNEIGPACIYSDNSFVWYKEGKIHREDGPAIILNNKNFYYINDKKISEEDFNNKYKKNKLNEKTADSVAGSFIGLIGIVAIALKILKAKKSDLKIKIPQQIKIHEKI